MRAWRRLDIRLFASYALVALVVFGALAVTVPGGAVPPPHNAVLNWLPMVTSFYRNRALDGQGSLDAEPRNQTVQGHERPVWLLRRA